MLSSAINKADHCLGNPNANIILLVYEDYECEYCGESYREIKALREHFKDKICIIYKHFPFIRMHPSAYLAALVVEACALQQKFIQAHDLIFECQEFMEYGLSGILHLLEEKYFISIEQLNKDLQNEELKRKINEDIESGMRCHITKTPAIFINGNKYEGEVKFKHIVKVIEEMIKNDFTN
ncbi:MAG: DsbA family protein [Chitinophagaceae bacterium]